MKRPLLTLSLAAVAVTALFSACQPEEEPTPADARDVYVAAWTVNENSSQIGASTYTVHINKSTTNNAQVEIENLYNIGFTFKAKADISGTTMTLNNQTYNSQQLHGNGTKTGANSISLTYYMDNGTVIDTCTCTLTRQ